MRVVLYTACVLAAAFCFRQSQQLEQSSVLLADQSITVDLADKKPSGGRASFGLVSDGDPEKLIQRTENRQLLRTAGELHGLAVILRFGALALLACPLALEAWRFRLRFKAVHPSDQSDAAKAVQTEAASARKEEKSDGI